jgi:hypothetical protein
MCSEIRVSACACVCVGEFDQHTMHYIIDTYTEIHHIKYLSLFYVAANRCHRDVKYFSYSVY